MEAPFMSNRRVVITGIGLVNPAGLGGEQFWGTVTSGRSAIRRITRFDPAGFPTQLAGELEGFRPDDYVHRRWVAKTDTFIHFALAGTRLALQDAHFQLTMQQSTQFKVEQLDPYRIGVLFGNNSGGWDISERGWYEYHQLSPLQTNARQATAWFPTGAQGFVTIIFGLKGFSKSFVSDRASGAYGLFFGTRSVQQGTNDVVLSGGTEAPISRLGLTCYIGTGDLACATDSSSGAYRPFDLDRGGLVLGEGATVLVLEELEHARKRGVPIYGEILGAATSFDPDPLAHVGFARAMRKAISAASTSPAEIDLILAEGCATQLGDRVEARAIAEVFGSRASEVPVTVPKSIYGHLYGASFGSEVACALLTLKTGVVPPTLNFTYPDPECPLNIVTRPEKRAVSRILVNARSREGANVSLVVGAL